jgi:hypothetical protein
MIRVLVGYDEMQIVRCAGHRWLLDKAAFLRGDLERVRLCSRSILDFETLSSARVATSEPYVANACLISGVLPASVLVKTSPLNRNGAYMRGLLF